MIFTASSMLALGAGSEPESHRSNPSFATITGMRVCRPLMPSAGSVVRIVQSGEGQGHAVFARYIERHLGGLLLSRNAANFPPLEITARRDQASPRFPCAPEHRLGCYGIEPGIDRLVADLHIFRPHR